MSWMHSRRLARLERGSAHVAFVSVAIVTIWIALGACVPRLSPADDRGSEAYFLSFSGHFLPFKPDGPVSKVEALKHRAYCRAEYDSDKRLIVLEKTLDGRMFFRHEYSYYSSGVIREARVTNRNGHVFIHKYDESGAHLSTTESTTGS